MASVKQYAYFLKGNKIAITEKDFTAIQNGQTLTAPSIDLPQGGGRWKSPLSTVTNGLEIEYAYSPTYRIESIAVADKETASSYETADGFLRFNGTSFSTASSVDYIVISGSERWNGLHKVTGLNAAHYTLATKYSGANVTETPTIYTDVDVLNDESDEIDLSSYLSKALVYYLKGRLAEDAGQMEMREYFLKEFRKMVEKSESSRIYGSRMIMPGSNAIR